MTLSHRPSEVARRVKLVTDLSARNPDWTTQRIADTLRMEYSTARAYRVGMRKSAADAGKGAT
jgi:hypothetical protein